MAARQGFRCCWVCGVNLRMLSLDAMKHIMENYISLSDIIGDRKLAVRQLRRFFRPALWTCLKDAARDSTLTHDVIHDRVGQAKSLKFKHYSKVSLTEDLKFGDKVELVASTSMEGNVISILKALVREAVECDLSLSVLKVNLDKAMEYAIWIDLETYSIKKCYPVQGGWQSEERDFSYEGFPNFKDTCTHLRNAINHYDYRKLRAIVIKNIFVEQSAKRGLTLATYHDWISFLEDVFGDLNDYWTVLGGLVKDDGYSPYFHYPSRNLVENLNVDMKHSQVKVLSLKGNGAGRVKNLSEYSTIQNEECIFCR